MVANEAQNRHLTVDYLRRTFAATTKRPFVGNVTFTSVPTVLRDVTPGSLFAPLDPREQQEPILQRAVLKGAYGILLEERKGLDELQVDIPIVQMRDVERNLGLISSYLENDPSLKAAVFICFGPEVSPVAVKLASLLHLLGNPVGFVCADAESYSVNRPLQPNYPLNGPELQQIEAAAVEDGAAALVIAADEKTLAPWALAGTQVDICCGRRVLTSAEKPRAVSGEPALSAQSCSLFGAVFDSETRIVGNGSAYDVSVGSDIFNQLIDVVPMGEPATRIAISMAVAADITPESIKEAIAVSKEFSAE
ncbi:MAG: hypothetical protein U0K19_00300 [Bifidobacteriaceae bacterium]|nr:hypothetical protein [Bifidobacteriaceae bacterium]